MLFRSSTIPPEPYFIPRKMKSLPVQSVSNRRKDSSDFDGNINSCSSGQDAEGNSDQPKLDASVTNQNTSDSPRPQPTEHALSKDMEDEGYMCRIMEEVPTSSNKNAGYP